MKQKKADPPPIGERLLTIREAGEILRLHPRTVRSYLHRGLLSGRLIGRQWRFRRQDLDRFFADAPRSWDWPGEDGDGD